MPNNVDDEPNRDDWPYRSMTAEQIEAMQRWRDLNPHCARHPSIDIEFMTKLHAFAYLVGTVFFGAMLVRRGEPLKRMDFVAIGIWQIPVLLYVLATLVPLVRR